MTSLKSFCLVLALLYTLASCAGGATSSGDSLGVAHQEPIMGTTIFKPLPKEFHPLSLFDKFLFKFVSSTNPDARVWFDNFNPTKPLDITFYRSLIFQGQVSATLDVVNEVVMEALTTNKDPLTSNDVVIVELARPINFLRTDFVLDVQLKRVSDDSLRVYFVNRNTQEIIGTYVLQFNEAGDFIKGVFAFVNPKALADPALKLGRTVTYSFDVSQKDVYYAVAKADLYDFTNNLYYTKKVRSGCYVDANECRGDYAEIITPSPTRTVNENRLAHFSYADGTDACFSQVDYTAAGAVPRNSYAVDENGLTQSSCPYLAPSWATTLPDPSGFLMRVEDTSPEGGDAKAFYGDGHSTEGWDKLTLQLVDEMMK
ncbi:hypothetical protein K1X76_10905 [bacterium]|nr:hypothetical protein [bacterium]